jgi:hypothetical protein
MRLAQLGIPPESANVTGATLLPPDSLLRIFDDRRRVGDSLFLSHPSEFCGSKDEDIANELEKCTQRVHGSTLIVGPCTRCVHYFTLGMTPYELAMCWGDFYMAFNLHMDPCMFCRWI